MKRQSFLEATSIREFVVENFFDGDDEIVKEDTSFLEEGNIYSWSIVNLASFLEEIYNIKVENNELVPENMDSLRNIDRFIDRKLNKDHVA